MPMRPDMRANDWLWGRMDAAATLVDLLIDGRRLIGRPSAELPKLEDIRRLVTDPPDDVEVPSELALDWTAFYQRQIWTPEMEKAVKGELEVLQQAANRRGELVEAGHAPVQELVALRTALLARRHWDLLRCELPVVAAAERTGAAAAKTSASGSHVPSPEPAAPVANAEELRRRVRAYDVGVRPALPRSLATLALVVRFYVLAWKVLLPDLHKVGPILRWFLRTILAGVRLAGHLLVTGRFAPWWLALALLAAVASPTIALAGRWELLGSRPLTWWLLLVGVGLCLYVVRSVARLAIWMAGTAALVAVTAWPVPRPVRLGAAVAIGLAWFVLLWFLRRNHDSRKKRHPLTTQR